MPTYAIGDIQGCYQELLLLLDKINFTEGSDHLWFTGDLVNRGPASLDSLRFVRQLGSSATTVLGNHDLHLLAVANGQARYMHEGDTFAEILEAEDRDELLAWLRHLPLMHESTDAEYVLVHAGMAPAWTINAARGYAREVEKVLRGEDYRSFFANMYGNSPDYWSDQLQGWDRLRTITNYFTRLRFCDEAGKMDFHEKMGPGQQAPPFKPWFEIESRRNRDRKIIFGHWAALRNYQLDIERYRVFALDTGCLWGGRLSALRLEDETWFSVPSLQENLP